MDINYFSCTSQCAAAAYKLSSKIQYGFPSWTSICSCMQHVWRHPSMCSVLYLEVIGTVL